MPDNAWSLLAFTLLAQMSVGAYWVAELLHVSYTREFGLRDSHSLRIFSRLFVFIATILAGVSAVFHLKKWSHAYHAFNNLKSSWVSKEMVFFVLFIISVVFLTFMSWRKIKPKFLQLIIKVVAGFLGLALIYSMSRIYMLATIPIWNSWITPGLFFTAALLLGTLAIICLHAALLKPQRSSSQMERIRERWRKKTLPNLIKLASFFLVMSILISGAFAYRLMVLGQKYNAETSFMNPDNQMLFFLKLLLLISGWILLLFHLRQLRIKEATDERPQKFYYGAFILIALAEIVGRYLFYVSFYRIGL